MKENNYIDYNMNFEFKEFCLEKEESCFGFCIKGGKKEPSIITVFHVDKLSPAERAGLKKDDIIMAVNEIDFTNIKLEEAINYIKTQCKIKIKVKRNNSMTVSILTNDFDIDLRKFDEDNELYLKKCLIIRSNLKQSFGFIVNVLIKPDIINILFVTNVNKNSPAAKSELKVGDAIVEVNGKTIRNFQDFYDVLNIIKNSTMLKLLVSERLRTIPNYEAILKLSFQCTKFSIKKLNLNKKKRSNSLNNIENLIDQLSDADFMTDKPISYFKKILTTKKNSSTIMKKIAKANSNRVSITKTFSSCHELHANTNTDKSASSTNSIKKIDTSEDDIVSASSSISSSTATITTNVTDNNKIKLDDYDFESTNRIVKQEVKQLISSSTHSSDSETHDVKFLEITKTHNTNFILKNEAKKYTSTSFEYEDEDLVKDLRINFDQQLPLVDHCWYPDSLLNLVNEEKAKCDYVKDFEYPDKDLSKPTERATINQVNILKHEPNNGEIRIKLTVRHHDGDDILPEEECDAPNDSIDLTFSEDAITSDGENTIDSQVINKFDSYRKSKYKNKRDSIHLHEEVKEPIEIIKNNETENKETDKYLFTVRSNDNCFYNRHRHVPVTNMNSIRYGTYKSKSLPNHVGYTPDGLVLLRITKHSNWPDSLGLKLSYSRSETNAKAYVISEFQPNGIAERLNIFEIGMMLIQVNEIYCKNIQTVQELEEIIERLYRENDKLEFLVKPASH